MKYEKTVIIPASEYDRINRLLTIKSLPEMTDRELREAGANTNQCEGILFVEFEDGSTLNYDLCSGSENYYDDVVWTSADGRKSTNFECAFELNDIEFVESGNVYCVHVVKGRENE